MPGLPESEEPFVLAAHDLAPSDTAALEREYHREAYIWKVMMKKK